MRPDSTQETLASPWKVAESPRVPSNTVTQQQGLQHRSLPLFSRPKTSKFKADRSKSGRFSTVTPSKISISSTPLHSSSKLPQTLADGDDKKQSEHQVINASRETLHSPSSTTIDAPSFTVPGAESTQFSLHGEYIPVMTQSSDSTVSGSPASFPSMIVDSPSFPPPVRPHRPERPPTIVSLRTATADILTELDAAKRPVASIPSSGITRTELSSIVAPTVLERVPGPIDSASAVGSGLALGKVSRFKKSRDGHS